MNAAAPKNPQSTCSGSFSTEVISILLNSNDQVSFHLATYFLQAVNEALPQEIFCGPGSLDK
jgi:hypothetical protein